MAYAAATAEVSKEERLATIRKEQLEKASKKAAESIVDEQVKLNSLSDAFLSLATFNKARAEAVKQLNELSPEYLGGLTTENVLTEQGTKLVNQYNKALKRRQWLKHWRRSLSNCTNKESQRRKMLKQDTWRRLLFWVCLGIVSG